MGATACFVVAAIIALVALGGGAVLAVAFMRDLQR